MMKIKSVPHSDIGYARKVKKYRAEIKNDLKKGRISPAELLAKKEIYSTYIANMDVFDILISLPGYGRVKAEKLMKKLRISLCKKIKGLGKKQKKSLSDFFGLDAGFYV